MRKIAPLLLILSLSACKLQTTSTKVAEAPEQQAATAAPSPSPTPSASSSPSPSPACLDGSSLVTDSNAKRWCMSDANYLDSNPDRFRQDCGSQSPEANYCSLSVLETLSPSSPTAWFTTGYSIDAGTPVIRFTDNGYVVTTTGDPQVFREQFLYKCCVPAGN